MANIDKYIKQDNTLNADKILDIRVKCAEMCIKTGSAFSFSKGQCLQQAEEVFKFVVKPLVELPEENPDKTGSKGDKTKLQK